MASKLGGFKKSSSGLQADVHKGARRNGNDRQGTTQSAMPVTTTDKSGKKMDARRKSDHGGTSSSTFQNMIGGPFGGRTGNAKSKSAMIDGLPR